MLGLTLRHYITSRTLLTQVRSVHGITRKYFIHGKNIFSSVMAVRTFLTRCTRLSEGATRSTSFLKPNRLLQNLLIQHRQMSKLDVNTNVLNNVILYKFDKRAYFRCIQMFALGQIFCWSVLAYYTYKPSFWDIFNTDINLKEYFNNNILRLSIFLFSIFAGPFMFLIIYALCARTIHYIVLNKGGTTLSIVTFHIRKKKSNLNIPIGVAKVAGDRVGVGGYLPIKIQNKYLYYLIDKQGVFVNPKLFDHTMG